jgi:hypothetical protein
LDRYLEDLGTEWSRAASRPQPGREFSRTSFDEHILLIAVNQLLKASDRAGKHFPSLPVDARTRETLRLLRHAYEHWETEQPAYRGLARSRGAIDKLAKTDPNARPWLVNLGPNGAVLAGTVPLDSLKAALHDLENALLKTQAALLAGA